MPTFKYFVDGKDYETHEHILTPRQILEKAKIDPQKYYLVQIEGQHQVSYQGKLDEQIHMHENMKFVTVLIRGDVPLSSHVKN